ncbi:MAG: hypothetical protein SGI91_20395 [Alphaproteobacteria bacterium]|nr:hypothetical protein [Alphaproteobacteria bacterium]
MHPANHRADRERPFSLIWHAESERVIGALREDPAPAPATHEAKGRRDVAEFKAVLSDVHMHARNAGAVFALDFTALSQSGANKHYMIELRQTPARLLPFLTPRLVDVPADADPAAIQASVKQLQSLFRRVIVEVPADAQPARFRSLANVTLAVRWGAHTARDVIAFTDRAHQAGLAVMICGVDEPEALAVAHETEVSFISGRMIGEAEKIVPAQYDPPRAEILDRRTAA